MSDKTDYGYQAALKFAGNHYENFPVASFLVPKDLRKHVAVIYWFARTADDIADEGTLDEFERLLKLEQFQNRLTEIINGNTGDDFDIALAATIKDKNLTTDLFYDLLAAFKQDISKKTYDSFNEILLYCKNSANPVGRLILELNNIRDNEAFLLSDKICTALQLTNFLQDSIIDYDEKGRVYLAADEMESFTIDHKIFELKENNPNLKKLIKLNVDRIEQMFIDGRKLLNFLHGRLKFEIKWTVLGGMEILNRIKQNDYNIFAPRPSLSKKDFAVLLLRSFL
jgi:squalene synthase HpnC